MNFIINNKKAILTGLSALFGAGAFVVDVIAEKGKATETAEKAAKIVLEQLKNQG